MISLPEGHYAEIGDGLRLHYHDVGEGPCVLFLHGSGPGASGWSNFRANAAFLAEHGYRSILADSIGYGHSSKPTDRPYTLDFMAGAALSLMDALGVDRFALVGNSQGGAQAMHLAIEHPERIDKLILMAPGGLEARETYMEQRGIRSLLRCLYGPEGVTMEGMEKLFTKQVVDPAKVPDGVVTRRYHVAMTQPLHVFRSMVVTNQEDRLDQITCPTLGFWGMGDLFCPSTGATKLAEGIADCRVVLINQCGHWVMVEEEELFNRHCLDFLRHG